MNTTTQTTTQTATQTTNATIDPVRAKCYEMSRAILGQIAKEAGYTQAANGKARFTYVAARCREEVAKLPVAARQLVQEGIEIVIGFSMVQTAARAQAAAK